MLRSLKNLAVKQYDAVRSIALGLETLFVYALGLGRYRSVLVVGIFSLVRGLPILMRRRSTLVLAAFTPFILAAVYLDAKWGQIAPVFSRLHFFITIASLIFVDAVVSRWCLYGALQRWSNGRLFKQCPQCKYDNRSLVSVCGQCAYESGKRSETVKSCEPSSNPEVPEDVATEIMSYTKGGFRPPSKKILGLVSLDDDEFLLIHMRIFPYRSFFKNGVRSLAGNLLLTTKRIYFIHSVFFESGWRMRECLTYQEVVSVIVTTRRVATTSEPLLRLTTLENEYEIVFKSIFRYREPIDHIVRCIQKRAPSADVGFDESYQNLRNNRLI